MTERPCIFAAYVAFRAPHLIEMKMQHEVVSGNPHPNDADSWAFSMGLEILEKFMCMPEHEQFALLQHLGLK
jgi:hypothetical protein